jgi:flagellar M-ring protein FliF
MGKGAGLEQLVSSLQRFGIGRLATIIGVSAGVAAALFALVLHVGTEPQSLLYANLDLKEAASITQALSAAGIKYEAKGDGSTIMVARDKVASTRLLLSSKGLPTSGSVGYEIFDNASALGQTDFVQNLNRQRALEGELARTIRSLDGVTFARVQLVLPKRQLFDEDAEQPSASVVIGVAGREPASDQVRALQNLVAGAVPNLKPDRVTIVDQNAKMLGGGDGSEVAGAEAEEHRSATEDSIKKRVKELVEGVVGPGKARVQVTADLDLSQVTTQEEKYDPDGQVVRSTQTTDQNSKQLDATPAGGASASANIPGTPGATTSNSTGNSSGSTEETTNYEISKTTKTTVVEPGTVKRISVAVAVDGVTAVDAKGNATGYTARSADEMKHIEDLVRSAVGFDATRGDQISVINVRFQHDPADTLGTASAPKMFDFDKNDIMRGAELLVGAIVAALIIFFVVRPLLTTANGGPIGAQMQALAGPGGAPGSAGAIQNMNVGQTAQGNQFVQGAPGQQGETLALPNHAPSELDQRINMAQIEGQVRVSSVKSVSDFVEKHPDESISILRSWLHEA